MVSRLTWLGAWILPWVIIVADYLAAWQLWNWFVCEVSLPAMIGIVLAFSSIIWMCTKEMSFAIMQLRQALILNFMTEKEELAVAFIKNLVALVVPIVSLAIGYVVQLWL